MAITMKYDKPTALRIRDFLLKQGLTVEGAYGLMANLYTESGFRSNNAQNSYMTKMGITDEIYTSRIDSGEYKDFAIDKVGYGLAQWTSSGRKQALYNYSKSNNVSISNETMQLNFLMKELSTSYKSTLNVLKASHSIRDCAKYVMTKFERSADQSENAQNKRADYGEQLYKELNDELKQFIDENNIDEIFLCGFDTDACVYKTALDLFVNNYNIYVLENYTMSHKGLELHNIFINNLKRLIGKDNVI